MDQDSQDAKDSGHQDPEERAQKVENDLEQYCDRAIDIIQEHAERPVIHGLYERKNAFQDHFAHAQLARDLVLNTVQGEVIPKGTEVLITVVSRFGDAGIRTHRTQDITHGYNARVTFDYLENIRPVQEGD